MSAPLNNRKGDFHAPGEPSPEELMQEADDISITLNDVPERVPIQSNLEAVIKLFGEADPDLIVELNGRFVYPRAYAGTIIRKGDRIEFSNPNFGG